MKSRRWVAFAACSWAVGLLLAVGGLALARQVLDRGVVYGDAGAAVSRAATIRAVNVQLELEPDLASVARVLDLARDAGFGWVRQQVSWADLEPGHKGNFWDYDRARPTWDRWDAIAQLAAERHLRVIARLELPPQWSRPDGSFKSHPPTNVRDYADFVEAFTARYRNQIEHVQLWNEPNLAEEWGRRPVDAAAYVELLRAGFAGARRGNPRATVVAASLAQTLEPDLDTAAGLNDLTFLERMYDVGAAPFFDVAAANAYGLWTGPDDRLVGADYTNFGRVLLVREVMTRHGDAGKPLWVSEFGWNAQPDDWDGRPSPWGHVDEATQAAYLIGGVHRAAREWPWMGPMATWLLRQPRSAPDDPTPFFALVREDWSVRPAYAAMAADARSPVLMPGTWPAGAPGFDYVGTWQVTAPRGQTADALHETPAPNAHLRIRFDGTRLDLIAPVGPTRGVAYITVDGSYLLAGQLPRNRFGQAMIDFGAPVAQESVRFPIATGLPDGEHRLELTVSGDAGTGSTAPGVGVRAIVVARDRSAAPETILAGAAAATVACALWWARRILAPTVRRAMVAVLGLRGVAATRDVAGVATLGVVGLLPLAPLRVPTPIGQFSPVELAAVMVIAVGAARRWLASGPPPPYRAERPCRLRTMSGEAIAAGLLLVAGTVGAAIATYPAPAWREWRLLIVEPVAWVAVAWPLVADSRGARRLALVLVVGAAIAGAYALVQAISGVGVVDAEGVERARAWSSSPNNLALLLGRTAPVAVALGIAANQSTLSTFRRVAIWVAAALICSGLFVTWSRGGWLAGVIGVAWVWWRGRVAESRRRRLEPRKPILARAPRGRFSARSAVGLGIAVVAAVAVVMWVATTGRIQSLLRDDGTGVLRLSVWESALAMIGDSPWVGLGLDQFVYAYPAYLQPGAWREPNLSHPHQFLLDVWIRLGAIGLVGVAALWWGVWRRGRHATRSGVGDVTLRVGAVAGLLAVVVHGLVDNSYFVQDAAYAMWAIVLVHRGASGGAAMASRNADVSPAALRS